MSAIVDGAALLGAAAPIAKVLYDIASGTTKNRGEATRAVLHAALEMTADELNGDLTEDAEVRAELAFMAAKLAKRLSGG